MSQRPLVSVIWQCLLIGLGTIFGCSVPDGLFSGRGHLCAVQNFRGEGVVGVACLLRSESAMCPLEECVVSGMIGRHSRFFYLELSGLDQENLIDDRSANF